MSLENNKPGSLFFLSVSNRLRTFTIPLMMAGVFIAIIAILILLWQGPWGISAGYRNWGEWFLFLSGLSEEKPVVPWLNGVSVSNLGIVAGAAASALLSGRFIVQRSPVGEYVKAAGGGILMGMGAVLAGGCNVGGFFSAVGLFSLGGYVMMAGLGVGAYIGLKCLVWEMNMKERRPSIVQKTYRPLKAPETMQQVVGLLLVIGLVIICYLFSGKGREIEGGLLIFGVLAGVVMHRSRFCFARAFRCPFMTGDSEMVKVVALSLAIYGAGAAVIKWSYIQPPMTGTHHPFWLGSLLGGVLFGIGMVIAGGCASSTLWRIGEGNLKLVITLVGFSLSNALLYPVVKEEGIASLLGAGVSVSELLSWSYTIPVFLIVLVGWVVVMDWNEKTDRFVIF